MKVVTHVPEPVPVPEKTYDFIGLTHTEAITLVALAGRVLSSAGPLTSLYLQLPNELLTSAFPLKSYIVHSIDLRGFDWSTLKGS